MEVLILSKTKYGNTQVCVGGICIISKQFVRLLNQGGYYQPADTKFNIGDIWDITFSVNSNRREPHNEDVTISNQRFIKKVYALETFIKNMGVPIWKNNITNIFEGKILWQKNGKGYFSENIKNYPSHSVGFWISDVALNYQKIGNQDFYMYNSGGIARQIVYKGNQPILQTIPQGKLIRLSLAKWWKPEDSDIEERCYLQLSGWYNDESEPQKIDEIKIQPIYQSQQVHNVGAAIKKVELPKYQPPKYEAPRPTVTQQPKNTSGSCYIATLCYEDYYADEVCTFRDFRDITLNQSTIGRQFVSKYYQFAPSLTNKLRKHKTINKIIKHIVLNPLLTFIKTLKLDKK
jgi:hypothetical protein